MDFSLGFTAASGCVLVLSVSYALYISQRVASLEEQRCYSEMKEKLDRMKEKLKSIQESSEADRRLITELKETGEIAERASESGPHMYTEGTDIPNRTLEESRDIDSRLEDGRFEVPAEIQKLLDARGLEQLETWMTSTLNNSAPDALSKESLDQLNKQLKSEKKKVENAEIEIETVKTFVKKELDSMTAELIKSRDASQELRKQIEQSDNEAARMQLCLMEAEESIEDLQQQILHSEGGTANGDSIEDAMRHAYVMRAEAAAMVEEIDDEVLQQSQSTEMNVLKKAAELKKAERREARLRKSLETAQKEIKQKTIEINYLTELIQILSSPTTQEQT